MRFARGREVRPGSGADPSLPQTSLRLPEAPIGDRVHHCDGDLCSECSQRAFHHNPRRATNLWKVTSQTPLTLPGSANVSVTGLFSSAIPPSYSFGAQHGIQSIKRADGSFCNGDGANPPVTGTSASLSKNVTCPVGTIDPFLLMKDDDGVVKLFINAETFVSTGGGDGAQVIRLRAKYKLTPGEIGDVSQTTSVVFSGDEPPETDSTFVANSFGASETSHCAFGTEEGRSSFPSRLNDT